MLGNKPPKLTGFKQSDLSFLMILCAGWQFSCWSNLAFPMQASSVVDLSPMWIFLLKVAIPGLSTRGKCSKTAKAD